MDYFYSIKLVKDECKEVSKIIGLFTLIAFAGINFVAFFMLINSSLFNWVIAISSTIEFVIIALLFAGSRKYQIGEELDSLIVDLWNFAKSTRRLEGKIEEYTYETFILRKKDLGEEISLEFGSNIWMKDTTKAVELLVRKYVDLEQTAIKIQKTQEYAEEHKFDRNLMGNLSKNLKDYTDSILNYENIIEELNTECIEDKSSKSSIIENNIENIARKAWEDRYEKVRV